MRGFLFVLVLEKAVLPQTRICDWSGLRLGFPMQSDLDRVLLRQDEIARRLDTLAAQITGDYEGKDLTVLAILNGSLIFMADLLRRIPLPLQIDCLRVRSYYDKTESSGQVDFDRAALPNLADRHVLLLDDILDSGHTLRAFRGAFRPGVGPWGGKRGF